MILRQNKGFTLIEMMIVVAVLSIIAAIAMPSFLEQVKKARRSDAKQALFEVAAKLEQYYQDNKGYPVTAGGDDMTTLGYSANPHVSAEDYYNISFVSSTASTYTIQAIPEATEAQADEAACSSGELCCGTYQLNQLGEKMVTGATLSADVCW